jgi:hypothetical protein
VLEGADVLEVVFDRRSAMPEGGTLRLVGQDPSGLNAVDWETEHGSLQWVACKEEQEFGRW